MKNKYQIDIQAIGEEDLKNEPWLLDIMKNKLKQVFMAPSLIIVPGKSDNLVGRILDLFEVPGHTCQLLMGIPGGLIEILVDNHYLIHFIFISNKSNPKNSRVSVYFTKLAISTIANSDTESEPDAN